MIPILVLDTETTHLRPDIGTPWEIAWTTAHHDPATKKLYTRRAFQATVPLSFLQRKRADPKALEIGRYEQRKTDGLRDVHDVIAELTADVGRIVEGTGFSVPHLIGAVPSFDHAMLCNNWLGWPGFGEGLWHYHILDVEVLAAGKLGIPPPYNSSDLTSMLGVTVSEDTKHTAAGDVAWALALYAAVFDLEVI